MEEAKRIINPEKMQFKHIQDRNGKSKQHEMEVKSTKRLEKIMHTEDRLRKVKNKTKKVYLEFLKKLTSGVLRCRGREPGGCLRVVHPTGEEYFISDMFRTAAL